MQIKNRNRPSFSEIETNAFDELRAGRPAQGLARNLRTLVRTGEQSLHRNWRAK
jgi:hypothetical protein